MKSFIRPISKEEVNVIDLLGDHKYEVMLLNQRYQDYGYQANSWIHAGRGWLALKLIEHFPNPLEAIEALNENKTVWVERIMAIRRTNVLQDKQQRTIYVVYDKKTNLPVFMDYYLTLAEIWVLEHNDGRHEYEIRLDTV